MKIKFTADSTVDLTKELIEKYQVDIIPLTVVLGNKEHKDGIDVSPDDIYNYVDKTGILPTTAGVNENDYFNVFKKYTDLGYTIIHFNISSDMSVSNSSAKRVAEKIKNVFVIDSRSLSTGTALLLIYAKKLEQNGYSAEEIVKRVENTTPFVHASFVLDNLIYLHKGGRCSSLALLGANLLKIKPCIAIKNGKMVVAKKYRGTFEKVVKEYVLDVIKSHKNYDDSIIFITHTQTNESILQSIKETIKQHSRFKEIIDTVAGGTVTSHCGKNTVGILFINKKLEF